MTQTNTDSASKLKAIDIAANTIAQTKYTKPFDIAIEVQIALRDAGYHITRIPVRKTTLLLTSLAEDARASYREGKRACHEGETKCYFSVESNIAAWQAGYKDAQSETCPDISWP